VTLTLGVRIEYKYLLENRTVTPLAPPVFVKPLSAAHGPL